MLFQPSRVSQTLKIVFVHSVRLFFIVPCKAMTALAHGSAELEQKCGNADVILEELDLICLGIHNSTSTIMAP